MKRRSIKVKATAPTTMISRKIGLLQEVEVRVLEAQLDAAGGERTGDEARQERPDPDRSGHADALEDVEDEVHRAVPWTGVTIVESRL